MELIEAINARRSIRLYKQKPVDDSLISQLIDAARMAPSAGNSQRLRYLVVKTPELVAKVLAATKWAAHVSPARTPVLGETAPPAFIAVCGPDQQLRYLDHDSGAAIENICLRAVDLGLGTCWLQAFDSKAIDEIFKPFTERKVLSLVSVGHPNEKPESYDIDKRGSTVYSLDAKGTLKVPKYMVDAIVKFC